MLTVSLRLLAMARSSAPSPSKSPTATDAGSRPTPRPRDPTDRVRAVERDPRRHLLEQAAHGAPSVVGDGQIPRPVPVEVPNRDGRGRPTRREVRRPGEAPRAVPQKNAHGVTVLV